MGRIKEIWKNLTREYHLKGIYENNTFVRKVGFGYIDMKYKYYNLKKKCNKIEVK